MVQQEQNSRVCGVSFTTDNTAVNMVQQENRIAYRELVSTVINDLMCLHIYQDSCRLSKVLDRLTQKEIASLIGTSPTVVSRAFNGVASLSAECFFALCRLHDSRLDGICEKVFNYAKRDSILRCFRSAD